MKAFKDYFLNKNMEGKLRGSPEIIRGILSSATDGQGPHSIAYGIGINSATLKRYLNALVESGFLEQTGKSSSRVQYRTTSKGSEFLNSLEKSASELEEFKNHW